MRIMAVDLGSVRTGIAICDKLGVLASPYCVLENMGKKKLVLEIFNIAKKENVEKIIIGKPERTDGAFSEMQQKAEGFASFMRKRTEIPIELYNEAYTTVIASQKMHENNVNSKEQKKSIDAAAATVLLQDYIDGIKK